MLVTNGLVADIFMFNKKKKLYDYIKPIFILNKQRIN